MNMRYIYFLIMVMCSLTGCISDNEPEGPSLKVGDSLPDFTVFMNDGTIVSTESLRGKIPVIVFFNTNCKDCQEELPVIQQLWSYYQEYSCVDIILIAREENEEEIEEYWRKNNFTMPYSPQDNREVYSLFAPSIIPRIYIADINGMIVEAYGDNDMPDLATLLSVINSMSKI